MLWCYLLLSFECRLCWVWLVLIDCCLGGLVVLVVSLCCRLVAGFAVCVWLVGCFLWVL